MAESVPNLVGRVPYSLKIWSNGDSVLVPESNRHMPSAGHWRVQATPRLRSDDMSRLAKANGWSAAETRARTEALIARKGSDVYIPRTKKVREVRGLRTASLASCPFNSGRVDGDYLQDTVSPKLSLRSKVREAVAAGLIAAEDAPAWAQPQ